MDLYHIVHVAISLFIFFGFIVAPRIHAPFCSAILMHWFTNNNRCIMSNEYEDQNGFTRELLEYVGIPWPESNMMQNAIPYILLIVPMTISVLITRM
jgi:hypothetical protein